MVRRLTVHGQLVMVDHADAPKGFYPVPKDVAHPINELSPNRNENYCHFCDWRSACNGSISCMSYNRGDGISVIFKLKGV
jgi:hypothetical protein